MKVEYVCIPIVTTILGLGFPILLQVVTRLEEKYSSKFIVELFKKGWEYRFFYIALIASIVFTFLWLFNLPPVDLGAFTFFIG